MSTEASRYIATVFAIVIVALVWNYSVHNNALNLALVSENLEDNTEEVLDNTRTFPEVSIQAQAAVVYDYNSNKFLFELNPDSQLPLASVTKLMTVYTALKNAPKDLDVVIDRKALSTEGDFGLAENTHFDLSEISEFTLVNSANDGAEAIANSVGDFLDTDFVSLMTKTGKEVGLSQTYFINPTGLDESKTLPSGYGSARDMGILAIKAYEDYKHIFGATTFNEYISFDRNKKEYKAVNTNQESLGISGIRLSKTGYTDIAGGNLVIVMEIEPKRPIAIVVLGSTKDGRFSDVNTLAKATTEFMSR